MTNLSENFTFILIEIIAFNYLNKRRDQEVFIISLSNIEKALKLKKIVNLRAKFFKKYHKFLPLFNKVAVNKLPPY